MEQMEIARRLKIRFPDDVREYVCFHEQVSVLVGRENIVAMLTWLRDDPELAMNHLMDLCGVDNRNRPDAPAQRFEVVYNLYSIEHRHAIRIRALIPEEDPRIDSITSLWSGADWHERECFDLLGITFDGHNDLRRILLPDDWSGHPLRKEYPLKGHEEWPGFQDLLHKVHHLDQFGFTGDHERKTG